MSINKAITSIWTLETIDINDQDHSITQEEEIALAEFHHNVRYKSGRYSVALPWKNNPPELPNNYALAKGVLLSQLSCILT